jgi:hypothetical protein
MLGYESGDSSSNFSDDETVDLTTEALDIAKGIARRYLIPRVNKEGQRQLSFVLFQATSIKRVILC